MHNSNNQQQFQALCEGLEQGDLARLIHPELHIDEFKSKMGDDADIVVLSFKVDGKQPGTDLMNFIERGYEWVLDADVSSGELEDGEYLVFAELERSPAAAENIVQLLSDIMNLTDQDLSEWKFQYRKGSKQHAITEDELRSIVPMSPNDYTAKFGDGEEDEEPSDEEIANKIAAMQESARIRVNKPAPKNAWTESLRVAAGLK